MSARAETWLWLAQRASAFVLALAVVVHIANMIVAIRGGLTAAEIVGRVGGNEAWLAFYGAFVLAVAVHVPIGLRTILGETTNLAPRAIDAVTVVFAAVLAAMGWRAFP